MHKQLPIKDFWRYKACFTHTCGEFITIGEISARGVSVMLYRYYIWLTYALDWIRITPHTLWTICFFI